MSSDRSADGERRADDDRPPVEDPALIPDPLAGEPPPQPDRRGRGTGIGPLLVITGGVLLAVSLLLVWFTVDPPHAPAGVVVAHTGWEAFSSIDVALTIAGVIGAAGGAAALTRPGVNGLAGTIAILAGVFAALLVTARMIDEPGSDVASDIEVGPYVALLATMLLVGGGIVTLDRQNPPPRTA